MNGMENLDFVKVGNNIKLMRVQHNMSQIELAGLLGISQTHMSNIERGRGQVTLCQVNKISQIFNCSLDEVVKGEESVYSKKDDSVLPENINVNDLLALLKLLHSQKK